MTLVSSSFFINLIRAAGSSALAVSASDEFGIFNFPLLTIFTILPVALPPLWLQVTIEPTLNLLLAILEQVRITSCSQ